MAVTIPGPDPGDLITGIMLQIAQHAERLALLDQHVADLTARLTALIGARNSDRDEGYRPVPAPQWWKLGEPEREEALARLRAWVDQIYRPSYGHLAAALGPCWEQHPLCLFGLDWLMELWSVLYLTPERQPHALASQAEWQTRLLPALAEQLYLETTRCQHAQRTQDRRLSHSADPRDGGNPAHRRL